jgi:hypothetical protein
MLRAVGFGLFVWAANLMGCLRFVRRVTSQNAAYLSVFLVFRHGFIKGRLLCFGASSLFSWAIFQ